MREDDWAGWPIDKYAGDTAVLRDARRHRLRR